MSAYRHRRRAAIDIPTVGRGSRANPASSREIASGIDRALPARMPYRIDILRAQSAVVLAFQGFLDADALADLRARIAAAAAPVELVLRAGTEVDPIAFGALRRLPVAGLRAESPFLTRWLAEDPS